MFLKKMEHIILEQMKALEKMVRAEKTDEIEIDEGGEEDEEKIADAIDTEDLGAKADMEWQKEKDERLGL